MKKVRLKRFAGPFTEEQIPFTNYVQLPIGLVPKAGGDTRLIFHLSYDFKNGNKSINYWTPDELCSTKYQDLDHAIFNSIQLLHDTGCTNLFYSKTDLKSAFRVVPIFPGQFFLLCMMARHPITNQKYYLFDKNMPFGGGISCSHFQRLSNGLKHIIERLSGRRFRVTNYLDDFLFIDISQELCNQMVRNFLQLCGYINFPVALEKTEWATHRLTFLGILIDGLNKCISVPESKREQALCSLNQFILRKKATVRELQSLAGTLNFLCKAIPPGRVFTKRMYAKFSFDHELSRHGGINKGLPRKRSQLKPHHHVRLDSEFKNDCRVWEIFLNYTTVVNRPFVDFKNSQVTSEEIDFYSDASLNSRLGFGCYFPPDWSFGRWEPGWIRSCKPSIAYVELFALCASVFMWEKRLINSRVTVFCDNKSVRDMVNANTSKCRNCMYLLRLLTMSNLKFNRKLTVKYIKTTENTCADELSRMKFGLFFKHAKKGINRVPTPLPTEIWPVSRIWQK